MKKRYAKSDLYRVVVEPSLTAPEYVADFRVLQYAYCDNDWEVIARGFIKWDGCVNWTAGESCMVHGCDPKHFAQFSRAMTLAYMLASEMLPSSIVEDEATQAWEKVK